MSHIVDDKGIIVLMYHRFEENKYPSTNIKIADFIKHIDLIKKYNFNFVSAKDFKNSLLNLKSNKDPANTKTMKSKTSKKSLSIDKDPPINAKGIDDIK